MSEKFQSKNSAEDNRVHDSEKAHAMALNSEYARSTTGNVYEAERFEDIAGYLYDLNPDKCSKMTGEEFAIYLNQYDRVSKRKVDAHNYVWQTDDEWARFKENGKLPDGLSIDRWDNQSPEEVRQNKEMELANQVGIAHANYLNAKEDEARFYLAYADPSTDRYKSASESLAEIEEQKENETNKAKLPFEDTRAA